MDGDTVRNLHVAIFRRFLQRASALRGAHPRPTLGAGIGGLALAMGLQKKGVPYTIYEAAPEYSTVALAQVHRCLIILGLASSDCRISAGIGFGPNGDLALDMLQEGFRAEYDKVCVGNEPGERQDIYYEGMLLKEGLGAHT